MRILASVALCFSVLTSTATAQRAFDRHAVEASVDSLMRAYAAAFESGDAERVVGFYAPGEATFGWSDGKSYAYGPTMSALRDFIRTSNSIAIHYDDVKVHAIANDLGAVRTDLRESWTDSTGKQTTIRVLASWVARKTGGRWQLVYFDGQHVPVAPDSLRKR